MAIPEMKGQRGELFIPSNIIASTLATFLFSTHNCFLLLRVRVNHNEIYAKRCKVFIQLFQQLGTEGAINLQPYR